MFLVDDCVGIRAAGGRVVVALESTTAPRNTDDYYFFYLRSSGYMPKTSATDTIGYLAVSKRAASVYDAVTMKEEHGADLDAAVDIVRNAACIGAAELKAFGGRPLYRATPTNGKR